MAGLLLIRHAETAVSAAILSYEWGLTVDGRLQAKRFAHKLPIPPDRLYNSEEDKAVETGRILADQFGIRCQTIVGVQEHDRTGVPYYPSRADFEAKIADFFTNPDQLVFGRERATEAFSRFSRAVTALPQKKMTAVVSHGTVITLFICHHNPTLNPIEFWHKLTMPSAFYLDENYQLTHTVFI